MENDVVYLQKYLSLVETWLNGSNAYACLKKLKKLNSDTLGPLSPGIMKDTFPRIGTSVNDLDTLDEDEIESLRDYWIPSQFNC